MSEDLAGYGPYRPPGRKARWLMRVLAGAALLLSLQLLRGSLNLNSHVVGCGGVFNCDHVLASRWSNWGKIPVSALAVALYLSVLGATIHLADTVRLIRPRVSWLTLLGVAAAIASSAVWFLVLQIYVLASFCIYCVALHVCGLILAVVLLVLVPVGRDRLISPAAAITSVSAGLAGFMLLMGGQLLSAPPSISVHRAGATTDTGIGPDRSLGLLDGRLHIRPHELPLLGSPDAPHIIVHVFDYTCRNCRVMHGHLREVLERYDGQLAIAAMPVPLEAECNKHVSQTGRLHLNACFLAVTALRVWRADRSSFASFNAWLFATDWPVDPDLVEAKAEELVGESQYAKTKSDPWIRRFVTQNVLIHGPKPVPAVMAGTRAIYGLPDPIQDLFDLLEKELRLQPVR